MLFHVLAASPRRQPRQQRRMAVFSDYKCKRRVNRGVFFVVNFVYIVYSDPFLGMGCGGLLLCQEKSQVKQTNSYQPTNPISVLRDKLYNFSKSTGER